MPVQLEQQALQAIQALQRPGKPDLLGRIVAMFEADAPDLVASLEAGVGDNDLDVIRHASHTLKSSSAYLGAAALSNRCRDIEVAAREGNIDDCRSLSTDLQLDLQETLMALRQYMEKAA